MVYKLNKKPTHTFILHIHRPTENLKCTEKNPGLDLDNYRLCPCICIVLNFLLEPVISLA